jgi:hypothetical protein
MKITKSYLKQIIKEELTGLGEAKTHEEDMVIQFGKGTNIQEALDVVAQTKAALHEVAKRFNMYFKPKTGKEISAEDLYSHLAFLEDIAGEEV